MEPPAMKWFVGRYRITISYVAVATFALLMLALAKGGL